MREEITKMNEQMLNVGIRIRDARIRSGLTQEQLAELADTSKEHLSNIENGKKVVGLEIFLRIRKSLKLSADYLLDVTDYEDERPWKAEIMSLLEECDDDTCEYMIRLLKYVKELNKEFKNKR